MSYRIVDKLTIPVTVVTFVAVGIAVLARDKLSHLEQVTQEVVDVRAARVFTALPTALAINEAVNSEKNINLEADEVVMGVQHQRYSKARSSFEN